jgi:hypothetical protein
MVRARILQLHSIGYSPLRIASVMRDISACRVSRMIRAAGLEPNVEIRRREPVSGTPGGRC